MREIIVTPLAPSSPMFSQGIRAGGHVYVSGTVGVDVSTGSLAGPTIQEQTRQALLNCVAIVEAGGGNQDDIAQVTVLLTHPEDFVGMNEAFGEFFVSEPPARAVAKLGAVLPGVLVSVLVTAYVE